MFLPMLPRVVLIEAKNENISVLLCPVEYREENVCKHQHSNAYYTGIDWESDAYPSREERWSGMGHTDGKHANPFE